MRHLFFLWKWIGRNPTKSALVMFIEVSRTQRKKKDPFVIVCSCLRRMGDPFFFFFAINKTPSHKQLVNLRSDIRYKWHFTTCHFYPLCDSVDPTCKLNKEKKKIKFRSYQCNDERRQGFFLLECSDQMLYMTNKTWTERNQRKERERERIRNRPFLLYVDIANGLHYLSGRRNDYIVSMETRSY